MSEYGNCQGCWNIGYIYLNGGLTAIYQSGATQFAHIDHLGSTRLLTGYPTPTVAECDDYYPFGELISCGSTTETTHKFTGKERDTESGNDYFGARYNSSSMGRFMSPDPANASVDFWLPQTWNRYSYVLNNPLGMVDKNGQWPTYIHDEIINQAFPGMGASDRGILKEASKEVDTHQASEDSWMHGMSDGNDPLGSAHAIGLSEQLGDKQILTDEAEAREDQAKWVAEGHTGLSPKALQEFGNALHIITDRLSPAHTGYQPWYGQLDWNPSAWLHFFHESWYWHPNVGASVHAAQTAFDETFGSDHAPQPAPKPQQGSGTGVLCGSPGQPACPD